MAMNAGLLVVLGGALGIAIIKDFTSHKIPNWLTASIVIYCLVMQFVLGQWNGLLLALGGGLVGLLCFMPSYLFGAMGAGDVKLMAAVGVGLGPWAALVAVLMTILAGGAMALVYITLRGGLRALMRRYGCMLLLLTHGELRYLPPENGEAAAQRIPYALAVACGAGMSLFLSPG